jgi:hypothetical protein
MSSRYSNFRSFNSGSSIAILLIILFILAVHGGAVLSQEVKDQIPRKPRFEHADLTITDNKTGLVWTVNANLADRQFSWSGAFDCLDRTVNNEQYASFKDWRVPTREEMLTLVEVAKSQGFDGSSPERSLSEGLRSIGFKNVQDDAYWSSSESRFYAAEAWIVDMSDGTASFADKTLYYYLWPVRSKKR